MYPYFLLDWVVQYGHYVLGHQPDGPPHWATLMHTRYLFFLLHGQDFWIPNITPQHTKNDRPEDDGTLRRV